MLLVMVNLAAVAVFLLSYSRHGLGFGSYRIDLAVYRMGGHTWLHGGSLYGAVLVTPAGLRLPFTYPPISAVIFSPLALLPMAAADTVLTVASIALAAVVLRVFLRRLAGPGAGSLWTVGWLLPGMLLIEPVRSTLAYGQVNIVLMALVTVDCLAEKPRWPRGALIGLAAAMKLTPAAFVLFFLLRRDYRAAATAGISFAAATAVGFVLAGPDSMRYWTSTVFQSNRIGAPSTAANQCIQAVLARAGLDPQTLPGIAAWLALSAFVVAMAWRGMRHAFAASQPCWALSLNAFAALLISPISWSHHWVWCVPALLTLADVGVRRRHRLALAVAACGVVLFATAPQWWLGKFAGPALKWAAWQQALGSSYVLFAVLVLFLSARGQLIPRTPAAVLPGTSAGRMLFWRHDRGRLRRAGRRTAPWRAGHAQEEWLAATVQRDLRLGSGHADHPDLHHRRPGEDRQPAPRSAGQLPRHQRRLLVLRRGGRARRTVCGGPRPT
jgi:alpha-1,2-mannosyltransferase